MSLVFNNLGRSAPVQPYKYISCFKFLGRSAPVRHTFAKPSTSCLSVPTKTPKEARLHSRMASSDMQWQCSNWTLLNTDTASTFQICRSNSCPVSQWPCNTFTFFNKFGTSNCKVCGAMATGTLSDLLTGDDDNREEEKQAEAGGFVGTRFRPLQSCSPAQWPSPIDTNTQRLHFKRPSSEEEEDGRVDINKAAKVSFSTSALPLCSSITNTFLRDLHTDIISRFSSGGEVRGFHAIANSSSTHGNNSEKENAVVLLTYNVWFREDLEVHGRMGELGNLIEQHQPHFICFQEVTPTIYKLFRHSSWWTKYQCSISPQSAKTRNYFCIQLSRLSVINFQRNPFRNSIMGRELCRADMETSGGKQLVIATTHLESPCPAPPRWDQMYSAERVLQAKESFNLLKNLPNVIFGGDMNWEDKRDGDPPLPYGWYDAWVKLRPGEDGWTYDTKSNKMLTGNRLLRLRLDRIFCHLQNFDVESIDMIGTEPIPALFYTKEKKTRNQSQILTLPVLPSDHYGLLLTLRSKN